MTEEQSWLLAWFAAANSSLPNSPECGLDTDYFDAKLIDSLKVIELIADLEEHFGIQFNEDHFQERRFSTVRGLGEIVAELRNHK